MLEDVLGQFESAAEKAHDALRRELSRLRAGRAHPDLLETLRVDHYGTLTPVSQVANVAVPEPRMLTVKPWEKNMVKAVERAIMESSLGLNPQTDGDLIRIPMPALTEERRRDLVKLAKKAGEDSKIAVRKARHDAKSTIDTIEKDGDASKDDCDRVRKKLEEVVQDAQNKVDEIVAVKEKDILDV